VDQVCLRSVNGPLDADGDLPRQNVLSKAGAALTRTCRVSSTGKAPSGADPHVQTKKGRSRDPRQENAEGPRERPCQLMPKWAVATPPHLMRRETARQVPNQARTSCPHHQLFSCDLFCEEPPQRAELARRLRGRLASLDGRRSRTAARPLSTSRPTQSRSSVVAGIRIRLLALAIKSSVCVERANGTRTLVDAPLGSGRPARPKSPSMSCK
jgi:hypothetical protein